MTDPRFTLTKDYQRALEDYRTAQTALELAHQLATETEDRLQHAWEDLCALWPDMKFDPPWRRC